MGQLCTVTLSLSSYLAFSKSWSSHSKDNAEVHTTPSDSPHPSLCPRHTKPYQAIPSHTKSYHIVPYHAILYNTMYGIPYNSKPFHTIPYYTMLYYTIHYHTISYHTITYHTIHFHTTRHQPSLCPRFTLPPSQITLTLLQAYNFQKCHSIGHSCFVEKYKTRAS